MRKLSRTALAELRELVDTLRPPDVDADGRGAALRKRVDALRAVHDVPIPLEVQGRGGVAAGEIAREALRWPTRRSVDALQHASPHQIRVRLELVRSEKTVKAHVSAILGKLGVADRTRAALLAVRNGLVDP